MRAIAVVILIVSALLTGCGEPSDPASACDGLADRWAVLHQEYLNRLATADQGQTADEWLGSAMVEQARDVAAAGCETKLQAGSSALCDRVDGLVATGAAAVAVLSQLEAACDS